MTVLIVEDNKEFRDQLCRALTDDGFSVYLAEDGMDALDALRKHKIDMIVSDVNMPMINGFELHRRIKKDYRGEFVLYTSANSTELENLAAELGITAFVSNSIQSLKEIRKAAQDAFNRTLKRHKEILGE